MTSQMTPPLSPVRYAGLDGLRALAVALVVAYHLFPGWWLAQGFIGVDVFFVISGFLITSLLLREAEPAPAERLRPIALGSFWRRRARRLLPALVVLIGVCCVWAWFIGGDVLVGLGRQVLGALTFSYNWLALGSGAGYFGEATPELFRNLWSLAVEEQFYLLWPLALPVILLLRPTWIRTSLMVAAAAGSAWWMAALVSSGADLTRAYFGTDTHAFGILLGVALAFALRRRLSAPARQGIGAPLATGLVGAAAVAGIVAVAALPPAAGVDTFPGALLLASILTVIAITAAVWPGSAFGPRLDVAPLRWVGERSYGIYLWHWPVLVLLSIAATGFGPGAGVDPAVGAYALGITLVAAALSYRYVEQPVRRHGFRGSLRRLGRRLIGTPATRFAALSVLTAGVLAACATTSAIASAPGVSSSEEVVAAGARALAAAQAEASAASEAAAESPSPTADPAASEPTPEPTVSASPTPEPTPVAGTEITAVGDSVMLASAGGLIARLPGIQIDAAVSRSMWAGPAIVESLAAAGQLRPFVVVALGTNGPVDPGSLERIAQVVGADRHLVLVNAYAPRDWIPGVNAALAAFAASHPGVVVADWAAAIDPHADVLSGDRIHPGDAGARIFADTVAAAAQAFENQRADAEYRQRLRVWMHLRPGATQSM